MRGLHYGDYDYDCESLHLAGNLKFFKEFTFFFSSLKAKPQKHPDEKLWQFLELYDLFGLEIQGSGHSALWKQ